METVWYVVSLYITDIQVRILPGKVLGIFIGVLDSLKQYSVELNLKT